MMVDTSTLDREDISNLSDTQEKVLSLVPIFPALLSVWGSANIIYMVLTSKKSTPYRRILLGLSCYDLASSLVYPWQAFLVPKATSQRVWAIGNTATCNALGFMQQLFFSNVWYNGMLSLYFLLTVKFGIKEPIVARRFEPWMHLASIGYPLLTACIGAGMGIYDEFNVGIGCWITNYPKGCGCNEADEGECCISQLLAWVFAGIPAFSSFVLILVNNLLVYCHVRRTIHRGRRHTASANNEEYLRRSMQMAMRASPQRSRRSRVDNQIHRIRAVATQASLYVAGFLISYTPSLTLRIMEGQNYDAEDEHALFPVLVIQALLFPLQGFFNCLVYVRPTYLRVRNLYPNESFVWAFRRALYGDKVQPTDERSTGFADSFLQQHEAPSGGGGVPTDVSNSTGERRAAEQQMVLTQRSDENKLSSCASVFNDDDDNDNDDQPMVATKASSNDEPAQSSSSSVAEKDENLSVGEEEVEDEDTSGAKQSPVKRRTSEKVQVTT